MPAAIVHDEDVQGVYFQLEPDDDEYVISFQRQLDPSDQDLARGYDKVCVTYYDTVQYGCVRGWELESENEVRLTLTPEAAKTFDVDQEAIFGCDDVDDIRPYYEEVREMLIATGELTA